MMRVFAAWWFDKLCVMGLHGKKRIDWGFRYRCRDCARLRWHRGYAPGADGK